MLAINSIWKRGGDHKSAHIPREASHIPHKKIQKISQCSPQNWANFSWMVEKWYLKHGEPTGVLVSLGFPKGRPRHPGHQTRQLQDRRCHTSNRAIDNYNFYPFLKVKDTDILLIFIWKFVGIQGYLWQLVCTNKYRIVRYGFSMEHRSWSEEQIL